MGTLTVRENLEFSANLRIGPEVSAAKRRRRVDNILRELGLESVQHSLIGTPLIRGIRYVVLHAPVAMCSLSSRALSYTPALIPDDSMLMEQSPCI